MISLATFLVDFTTSASQVATISGFLDFDIYFGIYCFWTSASTVSVSGFLDFCIYRFWVSGPKTDIQ